MVKTKRLEGRDEPILEPDLPIIDAHHHLFDLPGNRYMADDYAADLNAGHNVVASIYCETQAFSRLNGPLHLRPLGEVEFANGVAAAHSTGVYGNARINAAIVGHANLTLGAQVGELLDRCMAAAPDRFRGIRHVTIEYPDDRPFKYVMTFKPPKGVLDHPEFAHGLAEVARRKLIYDAAIFDPSLPRIAAYADRFPDLTIVLNHMGTAIGIDMDANEKAEVFARWGADLRELARRPNVFCKVGGVGMPMWGFRFEERDDVIGYRELADTWRPYVETAIAAFGTDRCMMESNFPPDGRSCGYVPLWNAMKHITREYSASEKESLYFGNAMRVYRVNLDL